MIEVGRVCLKIAGRDSNLKCVIVEVVDDKTVLIDGQTRRKRCNIKHIEALNQVIKIKKGATHSEVVRELEKMGMKIVEKKPKAKTRPKTQKPVKKRKVKAKEADVEKPKKKAKK